ncbi:hypothetical protein [Phaeobacter sp. 11ANDIMAR09]|uniref:hypothetical protein n=1 Tax=Phaeobacter sp. 11ANDIMAR09 TaxID=1225647 RepID=UPI0006C8B4FD|nr:hypothetical protein [Phaeobacter sp. 11ANDIMAR09]KPD10821.1 hypothetical protein AN476_18940 [Phaeobacter sp. 11ANDIMAR09]
MALTAPAAPQVHQQQNPVVAEVEAPEPNPVHSVIRIMRGRWKQTCGKALLLGSAMAVFGFLAGVKLYESQAILRVFPQESNILYATGDSSVLKTFDSFVKAETTYVASPPVMLRAAQTLSSQLPENADPISQSNLSASIEIRRSDSLIVLKTKSQIAEFAQDKLDAVVNSYLQLKTEAEAARSEVRLSELRIREEELALRLTKLRATQLEVGGEFGRNAITKAHIEKLAKIDRLAARKAEVAATLAALEANSGGASADTSDEEIMRATLLDRAMADLNFERAKLMSELAALQAGYNGQSNIRFQLKEEALRDEINVIATALADRREQIKVLGQTGALTNASAEGDDTSIPEIRSLYSKVERQLEEARLDARDLNRRRIELDQVEHDINEAQDLLAETRRALEVIRLESGRSLPGYAVLMSPASMPLNPASDSRKMLAASGLAGGAGLALMMSLILGFKDGRLRFAESLTPVKHRLPVLQVSAAEDADRHAADLLRNELQLHPLRKPRLVGKAPVIAVTRAGSGSTIELARALAESYARARMSTLIIEADIAQASQSASANRWRSFLSGDFPEVIVEKGKAGVWELPDGPKNNLNDTSVSAPMVRHAITELVRSVDIIVISAGSLSDRLSSQFVLSASDVGVLAMTPTDPKDAVFAQIERLDGLPRHGGVAVMRKALPGDPWLAVPT